MSTLLQLYFFRSLYFVAEHNANMYQGSLKYLIIFPQNDINLQHPERRKEFLVYIPDNGLKILSIDISCSLLCHGLGKSSRKKKEFTEGLCLGEEQQPKCPSGRVVPKLWCVYEVHHS